LRHFHFLFPGSLGNLIIEWLVSQVARGVSGECLAIVVVVPPLSWVGFSEPVVAVMGGWGAIAVA
jgi:hypothetical protein